ncbi:hypothetical protein BC936DRAFT_136622 [Jimgerdemannia flammicorona]|uniref:Uncharacterized protein n=1 Tax=Jimgerdemannia flammicorona TaxID=994334 RepID=A0A433CZ46_9FUNG|nr:hypothetical protein BC936DRAFT_136622 [Jimgerdemannia flammicorona]
MAATTHHHVSKLTESGMLLLGEVLFGGHLQSRAAFAKLHSNFAYCIPCAKKTSTFIKKFKETLEKETQNEIKKFK